MAYTLSSYEKAAISGTQYPYRVGVLVEATTTYGGATTWVDLNKETAGDHPQDPGVRLLLKSPTIKHESEVRPGRFSTSISQILLRNYGPYLHGSEIKMGRIFNVDPNTLQFFDINGIRSSITEWRNQRVKIRLYYHAPGDDTWSSDDLGTFVIEDIHGSGPQATMKLYGLERLFMDAKAKDLKEGDSWYTNIPLPDLIERIAEVGSDGKVELASKPDTLSVDSFRPHFGNIGLLPRRDNDGDRNLSRAFVCHYQWYANGYHWFVGYDQLQNKPAVMRWNEPTEEWRYTVATGNDALDNFACVFGHYDSSNDRLYAFAVTNRTGQQNPAAWGWNPINHDMLVLRFNDANGNLTYSTSYGMGGESHASPVYLPMQMAHMPQAETFYYWGVGLGSSKNNIAAPFPCTLQSSGFSYNSDYYEENSWIIRRSDKGDGVYYPYRTDNLRGGTLEGWYAAQGDNSPENAKVTDGYFQARTLYNYTSEPKGWPINSYSNGALHDAFRYDTRRGKVYWVSWYCTQNMGTGYWRLNYFDISSANFGFHKINFDGASWDDAESFEKFKVTAFDLFSDEDASSTGVCYVACIYHAFDDLDNPGAIRLYRFTLQNSTAGSESTALSAPTEMIAHEGFDSGQAGVSASRRYCPEIYSIRHNPQEENVTNKGRPLCGGVINRYAVGGPCYGMWYWKNSNYNGVFRHKDYLSFGSVTFPVSSMPFEFSSTAWRGDALNPPYWAIQDQGSGRMYLYKFNYPGDKFTIVGNGSSIDQSNTWSSSNIFCSGEEIFGVHASGPPSLTQVSVLRYNHWYDHKQELSTYTPGGRMMFWSYSETLSDLIEVADFGEDSSVWDALEMCRQLAGNYRMGIDKDGDLDLSARGGTPNLYIADRNEYATGFLDAAIRRIGFESVTSYLDYKSMANKHSIPIYEPGRQEPKVDLIVSSESTADQSASVVVNQVSNAAHRIVLRAATAGTPTPGGYDASVPALLFSWHLAQSSVETSTKQEHTPNDSFIDIYGLYADTNGFARLGDSKVYVGDEIQLEDSNVQEITAIDTDTGRVSISGPLGGTVSYPKGTVATITPKDSRRVGDSAEGVCVLTEDTGTMINLIAATGASVTVDDTSRVSKGMIISLGGAYFHVLEVTSPTTMRLKVIKLGGNIGQFSSGDTIPAGTSLPAYIYIEKSGHSYAIGGTGVNISVTPNKDADVSAGIFRPGDRIVIDCNGLQMLKVEHSTTRSVDAESVTRYGAREWKNRVENRLLNETRGKAYLDIVDDLTTPVRVVEAKGGPLMPGMEIGTPINVISKREFPDEPTSGSDPTDYNIDCEVISVAWNTETGTMDLKMRSSDDLRRAGDASGVATSDLVGGRPRRARRRIRR